MIKNYLTYIKENTEEIQPFIKIKEILIKVIKNLNINNETNLFKFEEYSVGNVHTIDITSKLLNNILSIKFSNSKISYLLYRANNNFDCIYINYYEDDYKIYQILKDIIIKSLIIEYFENSLYSAYSYGHGINLKLTIESIIIKYINNNYKDIVKNIFVILPSDISQKYQYLLKANNFDLI